MIRQACILAAFSCPAVGSAQVHIVHRNSIAIPATATDQSGSPFSVTGLSGIAYAGTLADGTHRFLAVMDNSDKVLDLGVLITPDGAIEGVTIAAALRLAESRDFEGIALSPTPGRVLLSEENTPGVREYDLETGGHTGAWSTPPVFASRRANFGFESLCRSGATTWTCNEEALTPDGPLSTPTIGTAVRLLRYDNAAPGAQHAYRAEPIHGFAIPGARSGVSDLLVLPDGTLLSLERSLALAAPLFLSRMFTLDTSGATDVSAVASLVGAPYTPVSKQLVYTGGHDNLEGVCLGPRLDADRWSLVGVVDDADSVSTNELVAFVLTGVRECPADWDASGAVDSADFFAFLAEFFIDGADFNADRVTDSRDFFAFLAAWFAGC